jgi:outer membrane biosynthesis protein TonB
MSEQKLTPSAVAEPIVPASMPRRIHVDSEVEAESLVYQVAPEIPHEAQLANVSGTVVLHAVVGIDGRPHDLQYISGPPLLAQAAIDTVTWWQYRINEEDVEIDTTIPVVFSTGDH